jgi:hypothetical protein
MLEPGWAMDIPAENSDEFSVGYFEIASIHMVDQTLLL